MSYDGGKGQAGVYQKIINMMPPHDRYVEAFLGGGSILLAKRSARVNLGIELNDLVASSFATIAAATIVKVDGSRIIDGFGDMVPDACGIVKNSDNRSCIVINGDSRQILPQLSLRPQDLVYCDPHYLMSTRSCQKRLYKHEIATEGEHVEMLAILLGLPCMVMVSGYPSDLYDTALAGWRCETYQAVKRNGQMADECVWCNFPVPVELHDYRFLGGDFRERERIKRKKERWANRLRLMPDTERYAILAAISDLQYR